MAAGNPVTQSLWQRPSVSTGVDTFDLRRAILARNQVSGEPVQLGDAELPNEGAPKDGVVRGH